MRTKLSLFLLLFSMSVTFSQGSGEVIPPSIPFPESIFEGKSGMIAFVYKINNKGNIIAFGIGQIFILQKSRRASTGYKTNPIYVDTTFVRYPYNIKSKSGLRYINKLKPLIKIFGEGTKFIKSENSDLDEIGDDEAGSMGYLIHFGDVWPVSDRHKFPKY
ncbi:MAG: hypothetical protein COW85_12495 [Ignavibacteria bacterium CG22_combo_CG10-13_8_21_14_all_37_15]|nr:hypothetical protein [Ignavibacteria bacterium]PIP76733.1 MAG: hypothetical protein COW85_12495 [Ignavibacteria bacterium CG22_combo_CG10-13_8_21_14_all_37_15]